jgi:hypothetical protein
MKKNSLCVCVRVKGQKNIFYDFSTFAFYIEKTWSWSGSKVKKTFSFVFYFHVLCRINMVLVGFKGQKNIFFDFSTFTFYVEKS